VESILPDKRVAGAMHAKGLLRVAARRRRREIFVDKDTAEIMNFTLEQRCPATRNSRALFGQLALEVPSPQWSGNVQRWPSE
jgi:hypothetical protein